MLSQAAEKATRAIMENEGIVQPEGHNFDSLASRFPPDGHPFKERIDAFLPLSSASTKCRSPSETRLHEPKVGEIETSLNEVEQFVSDVKQYLIFQVLMLSKWWLQPIGSGACLHISVSKFPSFGNCEYVGIPSFVTVAPVGLNRNNQKFPTY